MKLAVLNKTRRSPEVGDVFVMRPAGDKYLYGRVINIDANPLGVGGAILIYIYRAMTIAKSEVPELRRGQLLTPPLITNRQPWTRGYFEHLANCPLTPMDKLSQHCFKDVRGFYFNECGKRLPGPIEPVWLWGLHSFETIDDEISRALHVNIETATL
jgi:hypothetical protein